MEIWKDVVGHEGHYQVSSKGNVRSVDRMCRAVSKRGLEYRRIARGVAISPGRCRGYLIVNLSPKGTIAVHILVARAFVEGYDPSLEVNHKDGNKHNCAALNLEWTTRKDNLLHAVALGLNTQAVRVVNPATGEVFHSIAQAARLAHHSHRWVARNWVRA